jgi:FKBP-type peptidyl-prolyl cis-trans isomerase FkpA
MHTTHSKFAALSLAFAAAGATTAVRADAPATDADKTLYAIGIMMGGNVKALGLSAEEFAKVRGGFVDASTGKKAQVELSEWGPKIREFAQKKQTVASAAQAVKEKETSAAYLAKAKKEKGVKALPSGLIYKVVKPGKGKQPTADSTVKVHYEGKLIDGTVFDSSRKRNAPASFPLKGVIKCWTEGVALMKVGETARLVCPSDIAYGDGGRPPTIPGGATLVFEVELLEIEK